MDVTVEKTIYTDPRFLEVIRELLGRTSPSRTEENEEDEEDDVSRVVRGKIALRMLKLKAKQ